ncbi:MAG: alpha/beta fold hydrolase [Marmoricola sp.]
MSSADLHTLEYGSSGPRVLFCHGLFGQGRNWNNIAKSLSDSYRVTAVDLPNHGRSPWTDRVDYAEMADLVARLVTADDPVALVGHSMGGKVAMALALRHPELVERLCVVDIAPVDYAGGSEFGRYIDAMRSMDLDAIKTRDDAELAMTEAAPDPGVRAFLLQNLRREGTGWRWQANLDVIGRDLARLSDWPAEFVEAAPYEGPVLWMAGETSSYITDEAIPAMRRSFPRVRKVTIRGAGHWVHSDQPAIFLEVLRAFLTVS